MRTVRAARPRPALLVALAAVVLAGLLGTATAGAQEEGGGDRVVLRRVDARDGDNVSAVVSWSGDADAIDDIAVTDGDETPPAEVHPLDEFGLVNDIYLVVDTSTSTDGNNLASESRDAIAAFLSAGIPAGTRVSLMRAGAAVQVMQPPTDDAEAILAELDDLSPEGQGGLNDAIAQAGGRATDRVGRSISTVVLITDGDRVENPRVTTRQARTQLELGGVLLHVLALDEPGLEVGTLTSMAEDTGGAYHPVAEATDLEDVLVELRPELVQNAVVTFASEARRGVQHLTVTVGDGSADGSYIPQQVRDGAQNLRRINVIEPGSHGIFGNDLGKVVGLVAATLALILFAYGTILIFVRQDEGLTSALRPYSEGFGGGDQDAAGDDAAGGLAQTALLQRAVELTESFAESRGLLDRVERALERASLPLRAGEAMFFYVAGVVLVLLLVAALSANVVATALIGIAAIALPPAIVNLLAARKKRAFENLLPDTLQLLSSTLRAGYSMMQGVEAVAQESAEPMGAELRRVVTEARLGRPVEEALESVADRMESKDFAWAVMAIRIQREVGGNLAELLMTVAETMTQRERLRRDIRSLTAEGRISAWILLGLPVALGLFLYTTNEEYIGKLFDNLMGQILLGGGVLAMVIGMVWMMKIIDIEV